MADPDATIALPDEVAVVNIGLALFADAVRDQSTAVEQVDWRIPADGQLDLVTDLEYLYGQRSRDLDEANAEVVRRLDESVPLLVDVASCRRSRARDVGSDAPALWPRHRVVGRLRPVTPLDACRHGLGGLGSRPSRRRTGCSPTAR